MKGGYLFPPLSRIQEISFTIASAIIDYAIKNKLNTQVETTKKDAMINAFLYSADYNCGTFD